MGSMHKEDWIELAKKAFDMRAPESLGDMVDEIATLSDQDAKNLAVHYLREGSIMNGIDFLLGVLKKKYPIIPEFAIRFIANTAKTYIRMKLADYEKNITNS